MARRIDFLFCTAFMYERRTDPGEQQIADRGEDDSLAWDRSWEGPERRGNKIDLFHVGTAMRAECEMQADLGFSQDGNAVIQILGGSIRDIAAS